MIERPILFSAPMVIAILHGLKTQTRRVVKDFPPFGSATPGGPPSGRQKKHEAPYFDTYNKGPFWCWWDEWDRQGPGWIKCPYGQVGDRLWVRETFCLESSPEYDLAESQYPRDGRPIKNEVNVCEGGSWCVPWYRATDGEPNIVPDDLEDSSDDKTRWKPSIFMPRWASRIMLEITNVRVERLNEIDNTDAIAEGVRCDCPDTLERLCAKGSEQHFKELWNKINAKRGLGWDVNPWVWAIDFKRVKP